MRTTILFTVASLFLIGSYSLPQPEDIEASRAIKNREAEDGPGGPFPNHNSEGWRHREHYGGGSGASNTTKIKERQTHPGWPVEHHDDFHYGHGGDRSSTANATKIKERQSGPPGHEFGPPDGMTWQEFVEYEKHKYGAKKHGSKTKSATVALSTGTGDGTQDLSGSTTGNSTKVRLVRFKD